MPRQGTQRTGGGKPHLVEIPRIEKNHEKCASEHSDGDGRAKLGNAGEAGKVQAQKRCGRGHRACQNAWRCGGPEFLQGFAVLNAAFVENEAVIDSQPRQNGSKADADDGKPRKNKRRQSKGDGKAAAHIKKQTAQWTQTPVGEEKNEPRKGQRGNRRPAHILLHGA